jgi:hypothetical protein
VKRLLAPVLLFVVLAAGACGGDDPGADSDFTDLGGGAPPPSCPFTVEQVSEVVGQPMTANGNCSFGDGKGVASLTVTMASTEAGLMTYDYQRQQAGQVYQKVADLTKGDKGYVGVKDIEGEAVVVGGRGGYTLILSSFSKDAGWYEQTLRKLVDIIPA